MRSRLATAPWWVLSLLNGLVFATSWIVWNGILGSGGWVSALVVGAIGGAIFGGFTGPMAARSRDRQRAVTGDLPNVNHRIVYRAAARGPAPADPEVRAAAARLAAQQLAEAIRNRTLVVVAAGLCVVVSLALAVISSPWWLLGAAISAVFGAGLWWWFPRHLRHRVDVLTPERGLEPHSSER